MTTTKSRAANAVAVVLKVFGLVFSAGLTLSLFSRLFGLTPFGVMMAVSALALFEGGAAGWAFLLEKGREAQRTVAAACLVITTTLSVFSSASEIVLATKFGAGAFAAIDFEFLTLSAIVIALTTVVVGALLYEAMKPETREAARKAGFDARLAEITYSAQDTVIDESEKQVSADMKLRAAELAGHITGRAMGDVEGAVKRLATSRAEQPAIAAPEWPKTTTHQAATPAPVVELTANDGVAAFLRSLGALVAQPPAAVGGGLEEFDPNSITEDPDLWGTDGAEKTAPPAQAQPATASNAAATAPKATRPVTGRKPQQ
jgi:hypothetical protein